MGKRTKVELIQLRKQAKKLLLEHRMSQKDIADEIGVSENTMTAWVRKYHWTAPSEMALKMEDGTTVIQELTGFVDVQGFASYLQTKDPKCYKTMLTHLSGYLLSISLK